MNLKKSAFFLGIVVLFSVYIEAQVDLSNAFTNVKTIAGQASAILGGLVGLIGMGRAAYKFSNGDGDAVTTLIVAIVGYALGQVASTMI